MGKLIYGVGVNDVPKSSRTPEFATWRAMLKRSCCEEYKDIRPTYNDKSCCEEWTYLSVFKVWMQNQAWQVGLHLDKDILVPGNKVYSPDTCAFVPQYINALFNINRGASRGLPIGVRTHDISSSKNIYVAQCRKDGDSGRHVGRFETSEEAHAAWQLAKIDVIESTVLRYMLEPSYRQDVANAIYLRAEMLRDDHANHRETFSL